nr:hypothetical protein [Tanacetum cinerariifolium]
MPPKRNDMNTTTIEQRIARRVADALLDYEANQNSGNMNRKGNGNRNDNGNGSHNFRSGSRRMLHATRGCTYKKFSNCQPLKFKRTEEVVGSAHYLKRWNLCSIFVIMLLNGIPDSIQGNVTSSKPTRLQEAIQIAYSLMEQKIRVFASKQVDNKKRMENNLRDDHVQQPPYKRQNVGKDYIVGSSEKKDYDGTLPLCSKCKYHHTGPCTTKCENCKRIGHQTKDCRSLAAVTNQRASVANQRNLTCFECGKQGHYRSKCPGLKNQNRRNQAGSIEACGSSVYFGRRRIGVTSVVQDCVTASFVDMTVKMEKISSLEDTTILRSFPPLSLPVTTTADNVPGKSSYANVTRKPRGKKVNFCTSFTPKGNGIDVVVLMKSIHVKSKRFANTTYGFFLEKRVAYPVIANYGRSSYARAMIEICTNMELKDNNVVVMLKITGEGHYTCIIRVEYEWKPPRCALCKVFGHNHEECPKNTGGGETKNLKKSSQDPKAILVGLKVGFKPTKEYKHVPKKHTANSSGNKKKGVDSTTKVSDSNPFEVFNSVCNDVEIGTNGETSNLDNNRANSSGSSFWNIKNSSTSSTPVMDKIRKFKNLVIDGQAILWMKLVIL